MTYTKPEIDFIDSLLNLSLNNDLTYSDMIMKHNLSYELYNKLFSDINHNGYNLILLNGDYYSITTKGREVAKIGFENFLNDLKNEQETDKSIKQLTLSDLQKTDKRSKISFWLSVVAILVSLFIGILDYTKPETTQDNGNQNTNNTKNDTNISSKTNHSQNPRDFIDTTSIKVISDTTNKISKHNK
jgi:predicted transcriptional regulator